MPAATTTSPPSPAARRQRRRRRFALAWVDISTGEFRLAASDAGRLAADLARIDPREIVVPEPLFADRSPRGRSGAAGVR